MSGGLIARQLLLLAVTAATTAPMVANVMGKTQGGAVKPVLLPGPTNVAFFTAVKHCSAATDSSSEHLRRRLLLAPPADAQAYEPCVDKPTPEGFTCDQQKGWGKASTDACQAWYF
jgi:hypothetical protein